MNIEIAAVGGYGESGRNMTAVKVGDEVVIFDMGLHLPNYIKINEQAADEWQKHTEAALKKAEAIPQDKTIADWREKVVAIVISHAHLDHIGAAPYLSSKYRAPIICTQFAASILNTIMRDDKIKIPNKIIALKTGKKMKLTDKLTLEFIHITHSTPQTVIAALHTPKGAVVYANDYKMDDHPTLGKPVNRSYLEKLGKTGVIALIQDCLYADVNSKTPSEEVAKQMLREVLLETDTKGKSIVVTTFASHIARLKSIVDCGRALGRNVVVLGRSIFKYSLAAKEAGITDLFKQAKIVKYSRQARKVLKSIERRKDKYLIIVSGHQGEPQSVLSKMVDGIHPWTFHPEDYVVFSSKIIPAEINIQQRAALDEKLHSLGVRIFTDVHVSGHSSREDIRDMIKLLKPIHLIPAHGEQNKMNSFITLAQEQGYELNKTVHSITNGQRASITRVQ